MEQGTQELGGGRSGRVLDMMLMVKVLKITKLFLKLLVSSSDVAVKTTQKIAFLSKTFKHMSLKDKDNRIKKKS